MGDNEFTELPVWVGDLPALTFLRLDGNKFSHVPTWLEEHERLIVHLDEGRVLRNDQ